MLAAGPPGGADDGRERERLRADNGCKAMRLFPLALFVVSLNAFALERDLVVGSEGPHPWSLLERAEGTRTETGWRGLPDLVLADASYSPTADTELLLHFDTIPPSDAAGRYTVTRPGDARLSTTVTAFGTGSAAFEGGTPIVIEPLRATGGARAAGGVSEGFLGTGDFSIELWLDPLHLGEGETVFAWSAQQARDGAIRSQAVTCRVRKRTLEWTVAGAFLSPRTFALKGLTPLTPSRWTHHLLRYEAATGLLEYLAGGTSEAVTYATDTGHDGGSVLPLVADAGGRLLIGDGLTGLLDEMRVSHDFVEHPRLARYDTKAATAVTVPLDLGRSGSRLVRIEAVSATPGASAIELTYRVSEDPSFRGDEGWIPFTPAAPLDAQAPRGRFVQIRADLMSDGSVSPRLSRVRIVYEPNLPPPPPARVLAQAGDGSIKLSWRRVYDGDVAGYLVCYGMEPGAYSGADSAAGASPVDAGNVTTFTLTGLANGRLYYIAVVAYDDTPSRQQSVFSTEVTARPSPRAAAQAGASPAAGSGGSPPSGAGR